MWGPAKIPELAKSLGKAKGEFDKASKEYQKAAFEQSTTNAAVLASTVEPSDDALFALARKYNVTTEGKTKEQITTEMLERIKEPQSS